VFSKRIFTSLWKIPVRPPFFEQQQDTSVLHQLKGFYGIIGPNVRIPASNNSISVVKTLYELFTGDGIIQGVFFNGKGEIQTIKHLIETEKVIFEKKHGEIPKNILFSLFSHFLYKMNWAPNMIGYANTALGWFDNNLYAFYERDMPYLLEIDFKNNCIQTIKRVVLDYPDLEMCSGHTKFDGTHIHTVQYDVYNKRMHYYKINSSFQKVLLHSVMNTKHIPVIHDFYVLTGPSRILIMDSPFQFDIGLFLKSKIPVTFNPKKHSYIHIKDVYKNNEETYLIEKGITIFHYADVIEKESEIEIFASIYENLSFNHLNIIGKYRKIHIDKKTKKVSITSSPELEKYNLDFPVIWSGPDFKRVILRNFDGERNNGFVICEGLDIFQEIFFDDLSISGEPVLVYGKQNTTFLLSIAYDKDLKGYLVAVHMNTMFIETIELNMNVTIGFHSIFIENT
jgi:carotenoid cleavage dioxygenase-like enzyme